MQCTILPQDISQKMADSIFCYRKKPYWVHALGGAMIGLTSTYDKLKTGDYEHKIKYNDPELDFSSIPLGYVNIKMYDQVVYLHRVPVRKVKQGVNSHNTRTFMFPPTSADGWGGAGDPNRIFATKGFYEMITEEYPSLEEALKKLRDGSGKNVAISRGIALNIDEQDIIRVFYKNNYVGWIQPNKFTVHVKSNDLGWVISKYLSHILGWQID